jgi:hypothetical protein
VLYRPYDGFGQSDTQLVQQLHQLALSINLAKKSKNQAAVQGLYTQFVAVADIYMSHGAGEKAVLDLINHVHDAVIGTVQEVTQVAGSAAAGALGLKNLWPLAVVGLGLFFLPQILTAVRPRRRTA